MTSSCGRVGADPTALVVFNLVESEEPNAATELYGPRKIRVIQAALDEHAGAIAPAFAELVRGEKPLRSFRVYLGSRHVSPPVVVRRLQYLSHKASNHPQIGIWRGRIGGV
jgi:hypothetical protein